MKVLALYDIHGKIDALEAVLADPRAADPNVVVVGGDAVPGPFARATLDRLESLSVVQSIRGNGERDVAECVGGSAAAQQDLAAALQVGLRIHPKSSGEPHFVGGAWPVSDGATRAFETTLCNGPLCLEDGPRADPLPDGARRPRRSLGVRTETSRGRVPSRTG